MMGIDNINEYKIILASKSPRRQQLLAEMGIKFRISVCDFDESYPDGMKGEEIALYLARAKASCLKNTLNDREIIITADTIVWCNNHVLGKPVDFNDAVRMIREISDNCHDVITGVTIMSINKEITFASTTRVTFDYIPDEEINFYVEKFKPYDKAGAYGIQEWIGITSCKNIEGSYFNVVGLPVQRLYCELKEFLNNE
jgi:septum formation protein